MRTNKLFALLSAALVAFVFICPLQAQDTAPPDNPKVLIDKGLQAFHSYNFDQASILFRHALRVDNDIKKLSKGQREELVKLLDESAKGGTEYRIAEAALEQGKKEMAKGDFGEAKKQFNRVLASDKYVPKSWTQEAKVQLGVLAKKSKAEPVKTTVVKAEAKPEVASTSKPIEETVVEKSVKPVAENEATNKPVCKPAAKVEAKKCEPKPTEVPCPVASPVIPAEPTILDEILAARNVQREQVLATFRDSEASIRQAVAKHQFLDARNTLRQVHQVIQRTRSLFGEAEKEQLRLQVDTLGKFIDTEEQAYQQQQMLLQAKEAEVKRIQREQQVEQEKFDKIEKLFADAVKLRREKKYADAIEKAKEILDIEPNF